METPIWPRFPKLGVTTDSDLQRKVGAALHQQHVVVRHMIYDCLQADEDILKYYDQMTAQVGYYSEYVKAVMHIREHNFKKYYNSGKYNIISLGLDCLPRSFSAKYGLIASRKIGRLTCPFDLAVHQMKGMYAAIDQHFKNYGDSKNMGFNENGYVYDSQYGAVFNHDSQFVKSKDDFLKLSGKVAERIKSFEKYVSDDVFKVFFVHLPYSKSSDDIEMLYKLLLDRYQVKNHYIYAIATASMKTKRIVQNKMGCWHCVPFPVPNYVWHHVRSYATDEGVDFENSVMEVLYGILDGVV